MCIDTVHSSFGMNRGGSMQWTLSLYLQSTISNFMTSATLAAPCSVRFPFLSSFATLRHQTLALFHRSYSRGTTTVFLFSCIQCQHISRLRSFVRFSFISYLFMCRINFVICFSRLRPSHDNIATRYRCARRRAQNAVKVFM